MKRSFFIAAAAAVAVLPMPKPVEIVNKRFRHELPIPKRLITTSNMIETHRRLTRIYPTMLIVPPEYLDVARELIDAEFKPRES